MIDGCWFFFWIFFLNKKKSEFGKTRNIQSHSRLSSSESRLMVCNMYKNHSQTERYLHIYIFFSFSHCTRCTILPSPIRLWAHAHAPIDITIIVTVTIIIIIITALQLNLPYFHILTRLGNQSINQSQHLSISASQHLTKKESKKQRISLSHHHIITASQHLSISASQHLRIHPWCKSVTKVSCTEPSRAELHNTIQ